VAAYKNYELTANSVLKDGKELPQDRWYLSKEMGVMLCDQDDADFDPNFEGDYDLSAVRMTASEQKEYEKLLPIQQRVEESFKNGEWEFKSTSSWEQDLGSPTKRTWERWEHPEFGVVTKHYASEQWSVPSKYSADRYKYMALLGKKSALERRMRFEAWVDYWEKIDSHPRQEPVRQETADIVVETKEVALAKLKALGIKDDQLKYTGFSLVLKGASGFPSGRGWTYRDEVVWHQATGMKEVTKEMMDKSRQFWAEEMYSEYKKQQGKKPCKSFEKWLATAS
jgi:hypothetical protein